ncbi:MAG TPA: phosphoglycerate dehydrogenase [Gammaproteobacteria bacterium]|nr:phosphoglycerate dehydrogenase [Gammaproteobacteria bacterium]
MAETLFKIRTLNNIAVAGLRRLPRKHYEVASEIANPDAYIVRSFDMHALEIPATVLAVARAGAGTNNIPVAELGKRGIPVFNAPGANANAVKELVLAGMFMSARNLERAARYVRTLEASDAELDAAVEKGKKQFVGFELPGRTLGVVGLGAIGVEVANAALSLGMKVVGYDPSITVQRAWQLSAGVNKAANLDELFSRSDVVTLHVPLVEETRGLVSRERLRVMRRGSVVLNFARGGIVDEQAVVEALDEGQLGAYVNDFPSNALRRRDDVISLPHLGASTNEAEENSAIMAAENLKAFLEDGNVRYSVNFPETALERKRPHRLAIPHRNIPNMVAQILTSLAEENINIADLLNRSREELSYTIVDIDSPASGATLEKIRGINGILSVRVLPIIEG